MGKKDGLKVLKEAKYIAESEQARQVIRDWPRKTRGVVLIFPDMTNIEADRVVDAICLFSGQAV